MVVKINELATLRPISWANRQAALGVNHPFAAAPSLPAIGLGGGIVGFVGFPIGHGSRFCNIGRNVGIRSVIFSSILRRSANTHATCRSIAIAGNAARLHAVGLRARDATSRTSRSAIGGSTRAIDRGSSGAPFFVCRRPLLRHRRRNGAQPYRKHECHRALKRASYQVVDFFHSLSHHTIILRSIIPPHFQNLLRNILRRPPLPLCARFMYSAILCSVFVLHFRNPNKRENSHGTYP